MIQIVSHKSGHEAREALREFVQYDREKEQLKGLGEEAYAWGYGLANIAFVRGKFIVYTSSSSAVEDSVARALTQIERVEREQSEMRRLSREFARHVSNAIDEP
jgi:uncharacterized protein involved in exopolysaccharide biosynthesis